MTTFNWKIASMEAYPQADGEQDVVFNVNWSCTVVKGPFRPIASGTVPVTYTAGSPFTPYDQLTQDQVWGWVNPQIDRTAIEADLQALIDAQQNPEVVSPPLPWSN